MAPVTDAATHAAPDAATTAQGGRVGPPGPPPGRRLDGSMSLLVDTMADTLDRGYVERAAGRGAGRAAGPAARPGAAREAAGRPVRIAPLVALLALGLLTGTAVAQVRQSAVADQGLRGELAAEVAARTRSTDALALRVARLRDEVAAVQERALGADAAGRAAARRLEALGAASATTAVRGPGVVVTVDDAETDGSAGVDPLRGGTAPEGRVRDSDVQDVVNGLWTAGAEAVAVNDQRLGPLSAIRNAGESILVDLRPLSPPYVVEAIGDAADLEVDFVDGPSGRRLATLTSLYGIRSEVSRSDELALPAASTPRLRAAIPLAVLTAPTSSPPSAAARATTAPQPAPDVPS